MRFKNHEDQRLFTKEKTIMEITELICKAMDASGLNQAQLSKKMGQHRSSICKILDGTRNPTLKTISDILFVMGVELKTEFTPIKNWIPPETK